MPPKCCVSVNGESLAPDYCSGFNACPDNSGYCVTEEQNTLTPTPQPSGGPSKKPSVNPSNEPSTSASNNTSNGQLDETSAKPSFDPSGIPTN